MKLTVIGASGRTGTKVLELAARRGHLVTALSRRPGTVSQPETLTRVVVGDGRDSAAVRAAITGADAVIAIVAARSRRGPHQSAQIARALTEAMTELGGARLVIASAYPLVAVKPRVPLAILRLVLAGAYADLQQMENVVSASGWPTRSCDSPASPMTKDVAAPG